MVLVANRSHLRLFSQLRINRIKNRANNPEFWPYFSPNLPRIQPQNWLLFDHFLGQNHAHFQRFLAFFQTIGIILVF